MSYDLLIFDADNAPRSRTAFMHWFQEQLDTPLADGFDDPTDPGVPTERLQAWLGDAATSYPPTTDVAEDDSPASTEYNLHRFVVLCAFRWSQSTAARELVRALATKHRVGIYEFGFDEDGIWFPTPTGVLEQLGPDTLEITPHPRAALPPRSRRPTA